MPRTCLQRLLAALSVVLVLTVVTACGDDVDSPSLPGAASAASDDAGSGGGETEETADLSREDAMLKYAQCMREHGVDMPDPEPGGGIRLNGSGLSEEEMRAAEEACQQWMDLAAPEDGERREMSEEDKQAMLDLAQCMRDKGYDFADPQFEGGRVTQRVERGEGAGPGPDDPQFRSDHEECATQAGLDLGGMGLDRKER